MSNEPQAPVKTPYTLALQTLVELLKSGDHSLRFAAAQAILAVTDGKERAG